MRGPERGDVGAPVLRQVARGGAISKGVGGRACVSEYEGWRTPGIISDKDAPAQRRRIFARALNDPDGRCCVHAACTQQRSYDWSSLLRRGLRVFQADSGRKGKATTVEDRASTAVGRRRFRPGADARARKATTPPKRARGTLRNASRGYFARRHTSVFCPPAMRVKVSVISFALSEVMLRF